MDLSKMTMDELETLIARLQSELATLQAGYQAKLDEITRKRNSAVLEQPTKRGPT